MHTRDTCEAIEPLLAPYTEPDSAALMDAADQARVAAHLEACEPCRRTAGCCRAAQAALRSNAGALSAEAPGLLGTKAIKWNFTKFLVGRDGQVIKRYAPTDTPESLREDIEQALAI